MPEFPEHHCRIEIEGGDEYVSQIKAYSISSDYTVPTDGWSVDLYDHEKGSELRKVFLPLTPVRIYIDNALQCVGRIDVTEGIENSGLRIQGRDYIADLADASVDPTLKFKKSTSLADAILDIFEPFGVVVVASEGNAAFRNILTGGSVSSDVKIAPDRSHVTAKLDEFKANYNTGAFQLAANIAARHGFTIQPTERRDTVALCEPEYGTKAVYKLSRGQFGNLLRGSARRDWSRVPTLAIAHGKATQTGKKNTTSRKLEALDELGPTLEEAEILSAVNAQSVRRKPGEGASPGFYRPMYMQDSKARNQEQLERFLRRAVSDRRHPTLTYRASVRGHKDPETDAYFAVDTTARVFDEIENIDEDLWIKSRTFANSGQGPTTELELIRPGTWVVS